MHVSREMPDQTEARLRRVIAAAELVWHAGAYAFTEHALQPFPVREAAEGLAVVRDEDVWSVLSRAAPQAKETFALFSFHFPEALDNSGFVGWLASRIKRELGSGVFCVCGQNSRRGGIFDYWGVPVAVRPSVEALLEELRHAE